MPWRYWRINTTRPSGVTGTTLTQGGNSLTQYSAIWAPVGSSTRSCLTVSHGLRWRYSLESTFHGSGSSGSFMDRGSVPPARPSTRVDDLARALEDRAEHRRRQL